MIAEMNAPISTVVFGLPVRICQPRPTLLPVKLCTIGLMMLVVNEVIRALNARATTSPTATTITSPRKRKFLKPLINLLSIRDTRGGHPRTPGLAAPFPAIAWRLRLWTCHTIPVPSRQRKHFRRAVIGLTCDPNGPVTQRRLSTGECRGGRGRVGGRGEQPVGAGEPDGPGV